VRIAIAINSAQSRVKLEAALEKSQGQAGEMESQQEELQALSEELEEKARVLEERIKSEA